MMRCPNCGKYTSFMQHHMQLRSAEGEWYEEEWLVCEECFSYTDQRELEAANER